MHSKIIVSFLIYFAAIQVLKAETDYAGKAGQIECQNLVRTTVDSRSWRRGGAPGGSPEAPFGIPVFAWTREVWQAFHARAIDCSKGKQTVEGSIIASLISSSYRENGPIAEQAARELESLQAWKASILKSAKDSVDQGGTADELAVKLEGLRRLADTPPTPSAKRSGRGVVAAAPGLVQTDVDEINAALLALEDKIRSVRLAEAEAWEKGKPEREAKAEAAKADAARRAAEDARIQKFAREKAEAEAAQRAEVEAQLRREEREKAETKRITEERLKVERESRLAAEKAEEARISSERLANACPSFKAKDGYYATRMKRSVELGEKLKNAPAISLNGPGAACPFFDDQISIYKEIHDDLYACLNSGEPKVKEAVENMTGMVMLFQQQKQGVGCP
ncbi:hypothetical protein [Methylorubrum populi]|uniref:Uncharacterized protein n=1 Tax=Methylorubrum populi TaxID=223967 RepID=A0A833J274_9HYPH|nr:hypothetical protein [Methylorubrum populi]KAB7782282.1 hypothetical protein F8B43_5037 [Methylorubrum populi]